MSQDHLVRIKSTQSAHIYYTRRNKKSVAAKLELNKFDPTPGVRKHVLYKEAKK